MKTYTGIGSSFDSFLEEEGILAECSATATKRVLAYQIEKELKEKKITKTEMANKMHTSRAAVNRLLDPNNTSVTLASIESAAHAIGKVVRIEFVNQKQAVYAN